MRRRRSFTRVGCPLPLPAGGTWAAAVDLGMRLSASAGYSGCFCQQVWRRGWMKGI